MAVQAHLGGGAQPSTKLFVLGEFGGHRGIRDREVIAVSAAHAQRPVRARERSVRRRRNSAEQVVEKAARAGGDVFSMLGPAIVLPHRHPGPAPLRPPLTPYALLALEVWDAQVE